MQLAILEVHPLGGSYSLRLQSQREMLRRVGWYHLG